MLNSLLDWLIAVFHHWEALAFAGAAFVAFEIIERIWDWKMPKIAYLVFLAVALFVSMFLAWNEQHEKLKDLERTLVETNRPFLIIQELPAEEVRVRMMSDPRTTNPSGAYVRGWMFGKAPNGDVLFYSVKNIGKVVARHLEYQAAVVMIDAARNESPVALAPIQNTTQVLLPDQYTLRSLPLPVGTVYTGEANPEGELRFTLTVVYSGLPADSNRYYYTVVLRSFRFREPRAMNTRSFELRTESTDEGIVGTKQP